MKNDQANKLRWFLKTALAYLGTPYRWGGDDPSGYDCSGFVIECLKTCGLLKETEDLTADGLYHRFDHCNTEHPVPGCLLFTFNEKGRATHVVICLDSAFQIGASGGTRYTVNKAEAWKHNAYVKIRPIALHRGKHKILNLLG